MSLEECQPGPDNDTLISMSFLHNEIFQNVYRKQGEGGITNYTQRKSFLCEIFHIMLQYVKYLHTEV